VVPDLVAQVHQQGAVWLIHRDPQLLGVHIVALGQIQGDHAVVVAGDHRLLLAGQQIERQPVLRVLGAANDRQLQVNEFDHQPPLGLLGGGERGQRCGVGVVGADAGQAARRAQLGSGAQTGRHIDQPITFGHMTIGTQMMLAGVDRAAVLAVFARGDHQQRHVVQGEPQRAAARQTHRVLERQEQPAVGTKEVTHGALPFERRVHRGVDHASRVGGA